MPLSEPLLEKGTSEAAMAVFQRSVFLITFVNYGMAHFSRKCYTTVKTDLVASGVDVSILSSMDTAFMLSYALGTFVSGRLGDMFPQNAILGLGLFGSTLCLGAIQWLEYIDIMASNHGLGAALFVTVQLVHGAFQSTGVPVNTSVMGNWFPKKGRGLIFGLWTCHQFIGDIIAALATATIVHAGMPWQWALLLPGILSAVVGVINFTSLKNSPADAGLVTETAAESKAGGASATPAAAPIGFVRALMIPGVISYSIAFGFLKFVNYAMFFWLPFFLSLHFDTQSANVIAALYSVGMMPGGVIVGWVSDLFGGRRARHRPLHGTTRAVALDLCAVCGRAQPGAPSHTPLSNGDSRRRAKQHHHFRRRRRPRRASFHWRQRAIPRHRHGHYQRVWLDHGRSRPDADGALAGDGRLDGCMVLFDWVRACEHRADGVEDCEGADRVSECEAREVSDVSVWRDCTVLARVKWRVMCFRTRRL